MLEVVVLHERGTLEHIGLAQNKKFYANLNHTDQWCTAAKSFRSTEQDLMHDIKTMLVPDPKIRPTAKQLLIRLTAYDLSHRSGSIPIIFGDCCKSVFIPEQLRSQEIQMQRSELRSLRGEIATARALHEKVIGDLTQTYHELDQEHEIYKKELEGRLRSIQDAHRTELKKLLSEHERQEKEWTVKSETQRAGWETVYRSQQAKHFEEMEKLSHDLRQARRNIQPQNTNAPSELSLCPVRLSPSASLTRPTRDGAEADDELRLVIAIDYGTTFTGRLHNCQHCHTTLCRTRWP
jgi:hypothetical protein